MGDRRSFEVLTRSRDLVRKCGRGAFVVYFLSLDDVWRVPPRALNAQDIARVSLQMSANEGKSSRVAAKDPATLQGQQQAMFPESRATRLGETIFWLPCGEFDHLAIDSAYQGRPNIVNSFNPETEIVFYGSV